MSLCTKIIYIYIYICFQSGFYGKSFPPQDKKLKSKYNFFFYLTILTFFLLILFLFCSYYFFSSQSWDFILIFLIILRLYLAILTFLIILSLYLAILTFFSHFCLYLICKKNYHNSAFTFRSCIFFFCHGIKIIFARFRLFFSQIVTFILWILSLYFAILTFIIILRLYFAILTFIIILSLYLAICTFFSQFCLYLIFLFFLIISSLLFAINFFFLPWNKNNFCKIQTFFPHKLWLLFFEFWVYIWEFVLFFYNSVYIKFFIFPHNSECTFRICLVFFLPWNKNIIFARFRLFSHKLWLLLFLYSLYISQLSLFFL